MNKLTLSLLEQCDGTCRVIVNNGDIVVATLEIDENDAQCAVLSSDNAQLPGITNDLHLIACVTVTMINTFTDHTETFVETLLNEDGDVRFLDLMIV